MTMNLAIQPMAPTDLQEVLALWQSSEGIGLSGADGIEGIVTFLARNPGLSLVARDGGELAGAVLCGHDGRRGYLHHLAVAAPYRRRGVGRRLTERCLQGLGERGIQKCHVLVFGKNRGAVSFWQGLGWQARGDLCILSRLTPAGDS
jgi:putative acetyltransferase